MNPKDWVVCTISNVVREAQNTVTLRVQFPEHESINFIPGQYVMFGFLDGEESSRSKAYSISSSPLHQGYVEVTVKREGPFSSRITKLKVGDKVKIRGPIGHFVFKEEYKQDIIMIAGGTGIAPFRSMLQYIKEKGLPNKVTLLYGTKIPEDIIYKDELQTYNRNITVAVTLSRVQEHHDWHGRKGRITGEMVQEYVDDFKNTLFYICGPDAMVHDMMKALREKGAGIRQIKVDKWGT